jgi:WD40 repeat protein
VSASRDLTVRVWSLGDNGASLDFTQEGRSGEVARLGVSNDGRYFLFDIAQSLRLMTIPDRRTEGWLEGADDSYKFASFAVFSNDNKMILTGSQSDGRLSVWRAPTAGVRATEVRQFKPSQRMVSFTCAAISPRDDNPIAVTGTKSGEIYVWPMPTDKDALRIRGTLMFVDQNASATQQVRIWADFDNRVAKVRPGDAVTLVIEPPSK